MYFEAYSLFSVDDELTIFSKVPLLNHSNRPYLGIQFFKVTVALSAKFTYLDDPCIMDPLSLTASIIAVLGAGGTIAKGFGKIRHLKRAPDVLLQLNNEVTDLRLLIHAVNELYHQRTELSWVSTAQEEVVRNSLERAKHSVPELEKLIEYVLTKETKEGTEIDGSAWIRALDRIKEVKDNFRAARIDLNTVWTSLDMRYLCLMLLSSIDVTH